EISYNYKHHDIYLIRYKQKNNSAQQCDILKKCVHTTHDGRFSRPKDCSVCFSEFHPVTLLVLEQYISFKITRCNLMVQDKL
ncbi:hypothetical protein V1478_014255, partial [Vespula squamosa]